MKLDSRIFIDREGAHGCAVGVWINDKFNGEEIREIKGDYVIGFTQPVYEFKEKLRKYLYSYASQSYIRLHFTSWGIFGYDISPLERFLIYYHEKKRFSLETMNAILDFHDWPYRLDSDDNWVPVSVESKEEEVSCKVREVLCEVR